jgi:hypothetical protein
MAMNSTVKTVFCREEETVRGASSSGSQAKRTLQRVLQSAMGTFVFDSAAKQVFFTGPGATKVRRVIDVDAAFTDPATPTTLQSIYESVVDPAVTRAVEHQRDAVIVVAGDSRSKRTEILHGEVPDFTLDVPPRSTWGLAYRTVERLLELSTQRQLEINCVFSRVHLDHISDVLVNVASKQDKADADKVRAYYARLVALSHGSTLDLEEAPEGAKVKFQALDQVDAPIRGIEDFLHVLNCRGALFASSGPLMKLISKRGTPFYYVLSFSFVPADESPLTAVPHYINFVETGDLDWAGPDEDMAAFNQTINSISDYVSAVRRGDSAAAEASARSTTLGRVALGNIDAKNVDAVFLGTARYASAFRVMKRLAECQGSRPYVLLHGPDGEGEDDVDPELKTHVMAVQDQCNALRHEVNELQRTRDTLKFQIQRDDNAIARLQEQQSLVKRMTMDVAGNNKSASPRGAAGSFDRHDLFASVTAKDRAASTEDQKRSDSEARRAAQLAALDRDLALMKEDDARKHEATQQQIRFLHAESRRCQNNAQLLERELAQLEKSLSDQDARFKLEREQREREMEEQIASLISQNKAMLDARNAARREAIRTTQDATLRNHETAMRQEKLFLEELSKNTSDLAKRIETENAAWERKLETLNGQLVDVAQKRDAINAERHAAETRFGEEMKALDMEAVVLCKYLSDVTNVLWRFENHSSSEAARVVNVPLCNVSVFDMTARHKPATLERMCARVRGWLADRGVPGPLVYHNLDTNAVEFVGEPNP